MSCCRGRPLGPCTGWHPQSADFGSHPDWEAGFVYTYSLCATSVPGAISVAPVGALHPRAAGPVRVERAPVHVALPSRRRSSPCAGFVMTHLGWSYYDGPEARVSELSPRIGGSRHHPAGGVTKTGPGAQMRSVPRQRQSARSDCVPGCSASGAITPGLGPEPLARRCG